MSLVIHYCIGDVYNFQGASVFQNVNLSITCKGTIYSLIVLKEPLNTNQSINLPTVCIGHIFPNLVVKKCASLDVHSFQLSLY